MQSVYPSRACERVLFRERFRDVPTVQRNGGTLTGSPTVRDGVSLDGSTQYVAYDITGVLDGKREVSLVVEFTPDFDTDANDTYYFCDTTATMQFTCSKRSNAESNYLQITFSGSYIANIAEATYSPYWLVGERNVLVISSQSGDTNAWMNGTQILTADASTWTSKTPTGLWVGSTNGGTNQFDGVIHSISFHACLLDQEDAQAIYDGRLFDYPQRCSLWLDMAEAIIDGSNDRTLDKSRHGHAVPLGDGAGAGTPAWESPGFTFDAVDDYLTLPADPTGTFTVAWKRRNKATVFEHDLTTWNLIKASGSFSGLLDYLAVCPFTLSSMQERDLDQMWGGGR